MEEKEAISVKNVSKKFNRRKIIDNISFKISQRDIFGILGSSGSGKSVLLKMMMGFIKPDSGSILVSSKIGFSTQENSIYLNLTLKQNLKYFAKMYNVPNKNQQIKNLISLLGLEGFENTLACNLSGGTKKRLDIACALLNDPKILFLDEPFSGLDSFLVNQLSEFLKKLKQQGITIILSSHLLQQVENLCNKLIFLKDKKVFSISKSQLKNLYSKQNGV
jgi:ABC-2 type transport system ATP-binding protein